MRSPHTAPCTHFNPLPRVGGDIIHHPGASCQWQFQSTPPRGGDIRKAPEPSAVGNFNPLPRVGGDQCCPRRYQHSGISIHSPAWGGDFPAKPSPSARKYFNPLPRVGGDFQQLVTDADGVAFQSTPPRGGRQDGSQCNSAYWGISIHSPAWGETKKYPVRRSQRPYFNPLPRVGGDHMFSPLAAR